MKPWVPHRTYRCTFCGFEQKRKNEANCTDPLCGKQKPKGRMKIVPNCRCGNPSITRTSAGIDVCLDEWLRVLAPLL